MQVISRLSHTKKLLERLLDGRIWKRVEEQQRLRQGRGKTDGMFALR